MMISNQNLQHLTHHPEQQFIHIPCSSSEAQTRPVTLSYIGSCTDSN